MFEIIGLNPNLYFYFKFDLLNNKITIYDDKFMVVKEIDLGLELREFFLS